MQAAYKRMPATRLRFDSEEISQAKKDDKWGGETRVRARNEMESKLFEPCVIS